MKDYLDNLWWETSNRLHRLWLIAKHRPFLKCPICKGKGGEMSGYYEPEWSECSGCWDHWDALDDHGMPWFSGRVPVWQWVRCKLAVWTGMGWHGPTRVRDAIKCKLGWHAWINEDVTEPGLRICACCYADKHVEVGPMEFVWLPGGGWGWMPVGSGLRKVNETAAPDASSPLKGGSPNA